MAVNMITVLDGRVSAIVAVPVIVIEVDFASVFAHGPWRNILQF